MVKYKPISIELYKYHSYAEAGFRHTKYWETHALYPASRGTYYKCYPKEWEKDRMFCMVYFLQNLVTGNIHDD